MQDESMSHEGTESESDPAGSAPIAKRDLFRLAATTALGMGVGASSGAMGVAGAETDDGDNQYSGNPSFESVTAELFNSVKRYTDFDDGIADRPIVTAEPMQIWVDPDGDNDADGTETDPVASLQEALNRVPYVIAHAVGIVMTSGTPEDPKVHDVGTGIIDAPHISLISNRQETRDFFEPGSTQNFGIYSESGNPEDTVLRAERYLSFSTLGNSPLNVGLQNLTLEASVQCYGGVIGIVDCISRGGSDRDNMIGGYSSHISFVRGKITAPIVGGPSDAGTVVLNGTEVNPDGTDADGETGILKQHGSGTTVYIKTYDGQFCDGDCIKVPYFATGGFGIVITEDNIYHPAFPDGIGNTDR